MKQTDRTRPARSPSYRFTRASLATAVGVGALLVPTAASAHNDHHPSPQTPTLSDPIAQGLAGPLQLAVDGDTVLGSTTPGSLGEWRIPSP
jgi:hypothetical protein